MQMKRPHAEGDPSAMTAAFCQQLEMQMEAVNAAEVAQAFRVCAFRSRSVPVRSSFLWSGRRSLILFEMLRNFTHSTRIRRFESIWDGPVKLLLSTPRITRIFETYLGVPRWGLEDLEV